MRQQPKITKSLQRLLDLFNKIEDEDTREIISSVVLIESRYRSSSAKNFPMKEVRDVIDRVARLQDELERRGKDEV